MDTVYLLLRISLEYMTVNGKMVKDTVTEKYYTTK
jgi:hypothetical protein